MAFPLSLTSRYVKTPLIVFDGKETYAKWTEEGIFKNRPSDSLIYKYQVPNSEAGRPDRIALTIYGDSKLDWVLLAFNNVKDVFGWPKPLDVIEYPNLELVYGELL